MTSNVPLSRPATASSSRSASRPGSPPPVGSPPLVSILKHHKSRGSQTSNTGLPKLETSPVPSPQPSSVAFERTSTQQSGSGNLNYTRGVAFDTFEAGEERTKTGGGTGIDYSFTLQSKSIGYQRTRSTREFLVATDLNEYSVHALDWLLHNLVEDGDEVVVLRVVEPGSSSSRVAGDQEEARQEAQDVMDSVMAKNGDDRALCIIVEFVVGRIQSTIQRMIQIYRPDSLIVGTRGRTDSMWRAAFMGSTSRYMLEHSPVPVVVVRPERKVQRDVAARRADPKRGASITSVISRSASEKPEYTRRASHSPTRPKTSGSSEQLQVPSAEPSRGSGKKSLDLRKTLTSPA